MSSLLRQLSSGRGAFRKASVISFRAHLSCSVNTDEDVPLPKQKINFLSSKGTSIKKNLHEWGYKSYRLKQIKRYVNECGILDPSLMIDIPKALRDKLSEEYVFGTMSVAQELRSQDGTIKRAYRLHDGQLIESVLMPYLDGRYTACVSSQAGCAMKCSFCATGQMGFSRQLSHGEIFEQTLRFATALKAEKKRLSNVVFMGMGEPLNNYDRVINSIKMMKNELGIGWRHITISTVGIVPRIRQLAEEKMQVKLAVSLHQTNNAARSALMPVNDKYPIESVLDACQYYIEKTRRRISFEWALISGVTDTYTAACELGELLRGMLCHVNLIPLNPTNGYDGGPSSRGTAEIFVNTLDRFGVKATLRVRRGLDINAGCGQLTSELKRKESTVISPEGTANDTNKPDGDGVPSNESV